MGRYGIYLPMPVVATLLAFVYGVSIHRGWISAIITFCLVMLGGWLYAAVGQIIGVENGETIMRITLPMSEKDQAHV